MENKATASRILAIRDKARQFESIAESSPNGHDYWYNEANEAMHTAFELCREHFPGESIWSLRQKIEADDAMLTENEKTALL